MNSNKFYNFSGYKTSIIMSVYSEPLEWLEKSIESILNQDIFVDEFIIINDNPNRLELTDFLREYELGFSNIIIIKNEKNLGLISSLNKGIEKASGDYIARMDADDIAFENRISTQLKYLTEYKYDLIGANVEVIDQNESLMYFSNKVISSQYIDSILLLGTVPLVHPTYLGKSEVFKKCGYNENAIYAEDMEFIAHARTLGYKIGNCPDILLNYRFSESSITKSNAYISYNTAMSVKESFKIFRKTGLYNFIQLNKAIDIDKVKKFNDRQVFMNFAKSELEQCNYFSFIFFMIKAMISDASFFNIIYINIMQKYYVFKDSRECNFQS